MLEALLYLAVGLLSNQVTLACLNSHECGTGMCCRSDDGQVVTDQHMGHFGPVFDSQVNGTCSTRKAQKGEVCDDSCQCDNGLACYRPVSGVCCPPMTCYDEAYVKQQQAYWHRCFSDPNCPIPP
ncbi:uncharacterized protein LOC127855596 [Dreissena polymorpha]|uniref:Uncharacterized protein n=1 Tax=Dreissena polymorpha TaxID=45954 RepID=A0A9D4HDV2_DREPO|nr:uncharacterized protein LOC127855596 [Dreissena polymorpha]KAH3715847.1 hypothetical protein DPMN_058561 [Dreissena polymorpha]